MNKQEVSMVNKLRGRTVLCLVCMLLVGGCNRQGEQPPWTPVFGDNTRLVLITIAPWERRGKYQQMYGKEPYEVTLRIPLNYLTNPLSAT